ncbi:hypothetical protein SCHPADRAFT_853413 [Schizopora paradoxa]|uniref:C2 domain-containing protein n=1 Tax=Schizopora paradoxa TaxID=27342 RepID=A0A0H2RTS3_9AGAM|nr:hypothetical protein SCHPADRAFT_853413 [Schizopora paradoxa]
MSATPRVIGTLVVVCFKAQHLPNKRHIGKQDPYCRVSHNGTVQRTRAIKRGGQHPEWDEEVRFVLYEDPDDVPEPVPKDGASPPPPPPKASDGKKLKRVKGGNSLQVACFADDPKEPELIGETVVDLTEVLTKGETDEWFTLSNKEKFSGEVYLEMTFYSSEKPPEKKPKPTASRIDARNGYGGPGSFVPADGSPAGKDIPAALRASGSLAKLDLYVPPYDTNQSPARRQGSDIDQVVDEFSSLTFNNQPHRRDSFPPIHSGGHARPHSESFASHSSSWSSSTYPPENSTQPWSGYAPGPPEGAQPWIPYQSPASSIEPPTGYYQPPDYNAPPYGLPSSSSGFVPVSSTPAPSTFYAPPSATPAPSGFAPYPPVQSGFGHPGSHIPTSSGFAPPSQTPVPSGFAPPPSSMGFHSNSIQTNYPYQSYPPQPSSAPNLAYPPPTPQPLAPPVSHSAPPQQFQDAPLPLPNGLPPSNSYIGGQSPVHIPQHQQPYQVVPSPTHGIPQSYAPPQTTTPSPPQTHQAQAITPTQSYQPSPPSQNSRPLPMPGQVTSSISFPGTPPHSGGSTMSNPSTPARSNSTSAVYTNTPPRPPLPNPPMQSSPSSGPSGFVAPPPPPPLNPRLSAPPPPPPQLRESTSPVRQSPLGHPVTRRSSLPIPPNGVMGKPPLPPPSSLQGGGQYFPPPPPPPSLPPVHENQQHPLPYVPLPNSSGASIQVGQIYPGPPPRPPSMQYTSAPVYGGPPQY